MLAEGFPGNNNNNKKKNIKDYNVFGKNCQIQLEGIVFAARANTIFGITWHANKS